jgi:hypothetical protein
MIAPVVGSKNRALPGQFDVVLLGLIGSQFGNRNGFTQRAITGTAAPPEMEVAFEGLNASAVADAETVNAALLQIREKNVPRFGR